MTENCFPMALSCPDSQFVGVDLSARQIAVAYSWAGAVGLKNITFHHGNLLDLGDDLGEFDYIISHGLYSWVNRELYHTRETADAQVKTSRGRGLLDGLSKEFPKPADESIGLARWYGDFLRCNCSGGGSKPRPTAAKSPFGDWNLADEGRLRCCCPRLQSPGNEMLEEVNDPIYFHEFVERAARHGLQFLSEMDFRWTLSPNMSEGLAQGLRNIARDWREWEQYCDFLKGRTFRQTLLAHDGIQFSRIMKPEELSRLFLASSVKPVGEADIHSAAVQVFADAQGMSVSSEHPVTKAALTYLADIYPRLAVFQEVFEQACQRLGVSPDPESNPRAALDARMLCNNLFTAFTATARLIELSAFAPAFVTTVSERPAASPWARIQAPDGFSVTNLRHERVELDPVVAYVLPYVDGTRDCAALVDALIVEESLVRLARLALLIA